MALLRSLFEPIESFHTIGNQHRAILVQFAGEVLGVEVAFLGFRDELCCCSIALCHGCGIITGNDPQPPALVGQGGNIRSVLVSHCFGIFILEGYWAQANVFGFVDDGVLDRTKFFLLGERWPLTLLLGIKIFYLTLEIPPHLITVID